MIPLHVMEDAMSTVALPDPNTARAHISQNVHVAAFLDKLASIRPQYMPATQAELDSLLRLGANLYTAEVKTASAPTTNRFAAAAQGLDAVLYGLPTVKAASAQHNKNRLLEIGARLAADPDIFACATSLKLAQANAAA